MLVKHSANILLCIDTNWTKILVSMGNDDVGAAADLL
jgi:hypothetical protein